MIDIFQKILIVMIVKTESLKTRYQNERHINTVFLSLKTIKLYSKLDKISNNIPKHTIILSLYTEIYH